VKNGELQTELLGVREQNEVLNTKMERLTSLIEVLAERCDTQCNALLRYQLVLVCAAIPTSQVSLSLKIPLTHFNPTVQARMMPLQKSKIQNPSPSPKIQTPPPQISPHLPQIFSPTTSLKQ